MLGGMDPVTHMLTGACLARTGLNRKAAYATVTMALAAEMPDVDVIWGAWGPVAGFQHHRGVTHTLLGLPVEAAVLVGAVWGVTRVWERWRGRATAAAGGVPLRGAQGHDDDVKLTSSASATANTSAMGKVRGVAPESWERLFGFALVALLSHLLLDWTNNYGVRVFAPFEPRWYAGSFCFIIEPVMLVLLVVGLVAPAFFGLIGGEVGARRERYRGRGWARAALVGVVVLWGVQWWEHERAVALAVGGDYGSVAVERVLVSPYPGNPFRWHAVVRTPDFDQMATVDTWRGGVATTEQEDRFYRGAETATTLAAKGSWLGRVYLDWSKAPVVTEVAVPEDAPFGTRRAVLFRDLRFMYDTSGMHGREDPPISGMVLLDGRNEVVGMKMGAREQR